MLSLSFTCTAKRLLAPLFFLSALSLSAQVGIDFEGIITALNCDNTTCQYVDPGDPSVTHTLMDNNGIPVGQAPMGTTLGFESLFMPSRTGSSNTGLTDGDAFGVAGPLALNANLGAGAQSGEQAFLMEDTDGWVTMTFSEVELGDASGGDFSMFYLVDGSFEESDGANDRLYIRLEISNCAAATTVTLLDTDGGGSGGGNGGDVNDSVMGGIWNELTSDLSAYSGCRAQLIVEADMNSAAEEMAIDNLAFSVGSIVGNDPCADDTEDPVLACPGDTILPSDPGFCDIALQNMIQVAATDNCTENLTVSFSPDINDPGVFLGLGATMVTASATDAAGNTGSCMFTLTVIDTAPPVYVLPTELNFPANTDSCTFIVLDPGETNPSGVNDCSDPVTAINDYNQSNTLENAEFPLGTTVVNWTITDNAGNDTVATTVFNISFNEAVCTLDDCENDMEDPVVMCPNDTILPPDPGFCDIALQNMIQVAATDNCTENLTVSFSPDINDPGVFLGLGDNPITAFTSDEAGNSDSCSFTITVIDTEPPFFVLAIQSNVMVNTDTCTYVVDDVSGIDPFIPGDCSNPVTFTNDYTQSNTLAGAVFPFGMTTVNWTITDAVGNDTVSTLIINVQDESGSCVSSLSEAELARLDLQVFPNPAKEEATITFRSSDIEARRLDVRDIRGRLLQSHILSPNADGWYRQRVDVSGLPGGLYLLQVVSDRGVFARRLYVE